MPERRSIQVVGPTRREVITAASAGAITQLFGATAWAQQLQARPRQVFPLSVGYLEDSDLMPDLRLEPWWGPEAQTLRIIPAAQLLVGDQNLALNTVAMTVHGLYPSVPPARLATFGAVLLTVSFPSFDPLDAKARPFHCWEAKLRPGVSIAAPVRFPVPIGEDGALRLALDVVDPPRGSAIRSAGTPRAPLAAPEASSSLYAEFTVDFDDGRPKLQRGLYFLGLLPRLWRSEWTLPDAAEARESLPYDRTSVVVSFEPVEPSDEA